MVENIKEILLMENSMVKVSWNLKMELFKLVNLREAITWVRIENFLIINQDYVLIFFIYLIIKNFFKIICSFLIFFFKNKILLTKLF